jgi:hypothetical protein
MSKLLFGLLVLASTVIYGPSRTFEWLGPQAQTLGWKLKTTLDINRWLPQLSRVGGR